MSTRNVDLLIRARDGASKAFRDVSQALAELGGIQESVAERGEKLDRSLTGSKNAATALSRQIGSQTAREAQKAEQVFARIEATVDKNTAALSKMGLELAESESRFAALQAEAKAAEGAITSAALAVRRSGSDADRTRLEAAQAAYRDLNREIQRSGKSLEEQGREFARADAELRQIVNTARAATLALGEVRREAARSQGVSDTRVASNQANESARRGIAALASAEQQVAKEIVSRERAAIEASEEYRRGSENARRGLEELSKAEKRIEADIRRRTAAQANANARVGFSGLAEAENQIARSLQNGTTAARASERAFAQLNAGLERMRVASRPTAAEQAKLAASFRAALAASRGYQPSLRQVARELLGLGPASAAAAANVQKLSREMFGGRRAFQAFFGEGRKSLSFMQRIRGEVLSLTASFIGFFGIFQAGRGFLESFQSIEAATNRLGAAFNQDTGAVDQELARLNQEASRLGISFNVLSDNFSKFLLSGQQAGLETNELRTIFRQVSEAGRVLKLSNEQVEGTFNALVQIAGKGTLQMEELRQQLGDRLPGAVGIVAKALGFAEGELGAFYKAVENGEVGAREALLGLGRGLEETYGGQLEAALDSITAKLGALQNLFFQRQLTAANAGFISGLESAIEAISEFLDSREGIEFFEALGAAFERLVRVVPILLQNVDLIVTAFAAFVAIKVGQVISTITGNLARLTIATVAHRRVQVALNGALAAFSPAAALAIRSATTFGVALRGLRTIVAGVIVTLRTAFAALGGVIGIAAAALSFFAFEALAGVDDAAQENREAMRQVADVVGKVGAAYQEAAGDSQKFKSALENLPLLDMQVKLRGAEKALSDLREGLNQRNLFSANGAFRAFQDELISTGPSNDLFGRVLSLSDAFEDGRIGATGLLEGLRRLGTEFDELSEIDALGPFLDQLNEMSEAEQQIARLEAEIAVIEGTATEAQRELLGLNEAIEGTGEAADGSKKLMDEFLGAMRELGKNVPAINEELKTLDALEKIEADFRAASEAANKFDDDLERTAAKAAALNLRDDALRALSAERVSGFDGTDGVAVATDFLRKREGFIPEPKFDVNALRIGFGSDTVTLSDGSVKKVVEGMRITRDDANRDLARRISEEFLPAARNGVGAENFDRLNAQQQAALISLAYNFGAGAFVDGALDGVAAAVRSGNVGDVANAIRAKAGANGGINRERRLEEAALFESGAGGNNLDREFDRSQEEAVKAKEKQKEDEAAALESFRQRIAEEERALELQNLRLIDREVEKALDEERNKLAKVGLTLSEEQAAELEKVTRAKFAQAQADEDRNVSLEKARALEEQVTLLQERRRFLLDQQTQQDAAGDLTGSARTAEELAEVELALDSAIGKALQFWEAMGGEGSERAILGLQTVRQELNRVESKALFTGEQINNMIGEGLGSAVTAFAQAVANGENAWDAFRTAALQALSDTLIKIGQAIVQQALLNAITRGGGGGAGGGIGGFLAGAINSIVAHGGGIAGGAGPSRRSVNPVIFANAARYHLGGIAGLAPNEVPAILQEGEEILTEGDPRHRFNGGGKADEGLTIINTFDADEVVERALSTPRGQRALVNAVRGSNTEVKAALG